MKKWLIISHAFNMDGRAASQTITDKIPYLVSAGIQPIVLSGITGQKDNRFLHYQILPWGPAGFRFDFRHWYSKNFGRGFFYKFFSGLVSLLLLPFLILERLIFGFSSQSSWSLPAFFKAFWLIKNKDIDLIYSTGGAWSAHYAAWLLKKLTGIKWIAEIHDPMVIRFDQFDDGLAPRKNRDKKFQQLLEGLICKDVDHVWWFTDGALNFAKHRHETLGSKGFFVLPGAEPPVIEGHHSYSEKLHLCHFGSLASDRTLSPIIQGLSCLFERYPGSQEKVVIDVYGAPLDENSVKAIGRYSMANNVNVLGRLEFDPVSGLSGRQRVMKRMHEADVLLLLHGDYEWCAEYIPSKWYEYIWTRRPVFAITNRNQLFDKYLLGRNSYLAKTLDQQSINEMLFQIYEDWSNKNLKAPEGQPIGVKDAVSEILHRVYPKSN